MQTTKTVLVSRGLAATVMAGVIAMYYALAALIG